MTDIHDVISGIEGTDVFKEFKKEHDASLAHAFSHIKGGEGGVEIGYLVGEKEVVVFTQDGERRPAEEVLQESERILPLDIDKVEIGLSRAREIARAHQEEKYPAHPILQEICVLRQVGDAPEWNITLVLGTLNMHTIKISAQTGEVSESDFRNIMSLRKT